MGHNWRVIAPGRDEATGCLGQLIDALLSGSAGGLVSLLAVPLNAHRYENVEVLPGENVEDEDGDLKCTKRSRKRGPPQNHFRKAARIDSHNVNEVVYLGDPSPKSMSTLPSEIHQKIFARLDDVIDVLRFSLTNRYFWAVGLLRIEEHIVRSLAPWAGERIICINDRCDPSKYPPGLLSSEEERKIRELNQVNNLGSSSIKHSYKKVGGPSLSQKLQDWFCDHRRANPMSKADAMEIMMGLKPEKLELYPRDQVWILRNLTTKEYVRGEVIALKQDFIHGPQIDVFGFAEVLISRIAWSDEPERIGRCKNVARGKWAGHRFDVTPLSLLEQLDDGASWVDVSNEVLREIDLMVSGENGDNWRDKLAGQFDRMERATELQL
ncbi:hypothetical protein N7532_001176, partial [Penicillium argentinense]